MYIVVYRHDNLIGIINKYVYSDQLHLKTLYLKADNNYHDDLDQH